MRADRPVLPLWVAFAAAAFGGFVYDLGFPGVAIWPLAFAGIGLALVAQIGRRSWSALGVGFVFGAVFYLRQVDFTSLYLGPVPWIALSILEALFVALGGLLITLAYRWFGRATASIRLRLTLLPLLVAGLWCLRELASGTMPYGGFPWGRAGVSQADGPLADLVSWVGITGVSFAMTAITAGVIEWVRVRGWRRIRLALPAATMIAVAVTLPAWTTTDAGSITVASVQGNGKAGYFDRREPGDLLRAQLDATEPIADTPGVDVLLWPEGSSDIDPTRDPNTAAILDELSERMDAPIVLNTVTTRDDEYFNTSLLWRTGQGAVQHYDKRHPVPFGEYIPDRDFYYALAPDLIGLVQRGYTPGTNPPVFDLGSTITGLAICFDVIYDELIWEGANDGAEVYMLQTNNADFRGTDENLQQLAVARLRAIETGRAVVNLSTVGTSQVIDADGRTLDSLPAYEPGAMVTSVPLHTGATPAVVLGAFTPAFIGFGALAGLLVAFGVATARRTPRADRPGAFDSGEGV